MEAEREKFRAYIEQSGLMSALTNVLVNLYEEPNKPKDALNYTLKSLGYEMPDNKKLEALETKCKHLEEENQRLREQLASTSQPPQIAQETQTSLDSTEKEET